jgi:hypothetical protein
VLRELILRNVGPAEALEFRPVAPRLNLITGDNGLGKSFLLEAAWWALTRTWNETPGVPNAPDASITYAFDGDTRLHGATSRWDPPSQTWSRAPGRPPNPGLVIYARVDGSFSTWDPARNYRLYRRADGSEAESPPAYQFRASDVMEGLSREVREGGALRSQRLCAGLIDDWTRWQAANDSRFELLRRLLKHIGPEGEALVPGKPRRPVLDDVREVPTIQMPYGQEVPLTYCPAGVKRMSKLAYLLAWTLSEHMAEAERIGQPVSRQVIVLLDEPETHLHPRWQRTVLTGLQAAIEEWHPEASPEVQLLVATHSPLVLASMEPSFDSERDALWQLELDAGLVHLHQDPWLRRGDVNRWLTSDVFALRAATAPEVEAVLEDAARLLRLETPPSMEVQAVNRELSRLLPEMDPFFIRWTHYMQRHLERPAS